MEWVLLSGGGGVGGIGLKVKGEEEWKGAWGRVDEVFKGFQRKENSPLLSQKCSTLPPYIHSLPLHLFLPLPHKHTTPLFIYIIIDWVAASKAPTPNWNSCLYSDTWLSWGKNVSFIKSLVCLFVLFFWFFYTCSFSHLKIPNNEQKDFLWFLWVILESSIIHMSI